ncbi:sensor histidine kinase [Ilumatobacter sp.]|uniref:sensor histidine kinase n=1 Tax=Ilumatobacter sp. TaxID=1967498 RepID=UPI003C377F68
MTLRTRVVVIVTALVVCGITAASLLAYSSTRSELVDETDRFLEQRAAELTDGTRQKPSSEDPDRTDQSRSDGDSTDPGGSDLAFDPDAIAQTLDRDGVVTASSGQTLPVSDTDIEVAAGARSALRDIEVDGTTYRMLTVNADDGAVQVATATTATSDVLSRLRWRLAGIGVLLATLAALLGWMLMRRTTRPLEELTAATERVTTSADLTPLDASVTGPNEVGRLTTSFNQMLAALSLSRQQQRRLVQDAAHELRTPLTSLRTNIELLQRAPNLPPDEHTALMDGLTIEVTELSDLFGELIQLATDPTNDHIHVDFDVADAATSAVERFTIRTGRSVDLRLEPTQITGNPTDIERAITNLLSNADKFSPTNEPIEVELRDRRLVVRDRGPGIELDERDAVFDRFFRSDSARSTPGSGLGLAIVRQIAERHGGTAFVETSEAGEPEIGFTLQQR